jgi:peptidoglycan/xylan/chitin deacetylase (PgdA/CDA1 family)
MKKLAKIIIYAAFYYSGLWLVFWHFNRRKIAILMYHGVTDRDINYWTQLPRSKFMRQMRFIKNWYRPISLGEAVQALKGEKEIEPHRAVVTFDDGFRNNMTVAYPILRENKIPATVFLTTSFIEKSDRFKGFVWTDYIFALLRAATLEKIDLRDIGLGQYGLKGMSERRRAKDSICGRLKKMSADDKNRIIEIIASRLNADISESDFEIFRPLERKDIIDMAKEGLMTFGAHTVNHEILSALSKEEAEKEIKGSRAVVEKWTGSPIHFFAYPNGTIADFNNETKAIAAENFDCALTTIEGLNSIGADLYELRRINIGADISMKEFILKISGTTALFDRFRGGSGSYE